MEKGEWWVHVYDYASAMENNLCTLSVLYQRLEACRFELQKGFHVWNPVVVIVYTSALSLGKII